MEACEAAAFACVLRSSGLLRWLLALAVSLHSAAAPPQSSRA